MAAVQRLLSQVSAGRNHTVRRQAAIGHERKAPTSPAALRDAAAVSLSGPGWHAVNDHFLPAATGGLEPELPSPLSGPLHPGSMDLLTLTQLHRQSRGKS